MDSVTVAVGVVVVVLVDVVDSGIRLTPNFYRTGFFSCRKQAFYSKFTFS